MPEQKDHDIPKKDPEDIIVDPYWNSLISNPKLREAYNEAESEGYSTKQSHAIARIEVFGVEHARKTFVHNDDEDVLQEVLNNKDYSQERGDVSEENPESMKEKKAADREGAQRDTKDQLSLSDWGTNKIAKTEGHETSPEE